MVADPLMVGAAAIDKPDENARACKYFHMTNTPAPAPAVTGEARDGRPAARWWLKQGHPAVGMASRSACRGAVGRPLVLVAIEYFLSRGGCLPSVGILGSAMDSDQCLVQACSGRR
jgi:hypothetical protein